MTNDPVTNDLALLSLLQLASPALPVGAYSYSEGMEALVDIGIIDNKQGLGHWIEQELRYGAIRLEAAVMVRAYCSAHGDIEALSDWNEWLSAAKETEELRQQSWQMGGSLVRLLLDLHPRDPHNPPHEGGAKSRTRLHRATNRAFLVDGVMEGLDDGESSNNLFTAPPNLQTSPSNKSSDDDRGQDSMRSLLERVGLPCNYAIAYGIAAAEWQIEAGQALLGYLHSWATNLINAGVKLIPLGQTSGQQLLLSIHPILSHTAEEILALEDDALSSCGWGLALASMAHETQYTRLFRS